MGPRVLLVRFSSLGDVVLASAAVEAIRARHPDAHVTFATKQRWAPVVERMRVDRVVLPVEGEHVGTAFDYRVDLHASLRSAALRWRVGGRWGVYQSHPVRRRWMAWWHRTMPALAPVPVRYVAAVRAAGLDVAAKPPALRVTPTDDDRAAAAHLITGDYVVLCPGAAHASKRWPAGHWQTLAGALPGPAVATGTAAERIPLPPGVVDGFGLALGPTAALLKGARAVVSNDSGLMHLAAAVGTPVVALFGPTAPAFGFAPWQVAHRIVERSLPCRPCTTHGGPRCPLGHHDCLVGITPETVAGALRAVA